MHTLTSTASLRTDDADDDLADSQFDFPGSATGWTFQMLDAADRAQTLHPIESLRDTATPLAQMGCDDPFATLGRDTLHVGHHRRPCLEWRAPYDGHFCLEGEVALLRTYATGGLVTTVLVDDVEVLSQPVDHPQDLRFSVSMSLAATRRVRVVFSCKGVIDSNHALYYLRIAESVDAGNSHLHWTRGVHPDWQRLGHQLAFEPEAGSDLGPQQLLGLAKNMYGVHANIEPRLARRTQALAARDFDPHFRRLGQPRYFSVKLRDQRQQVP